MKLEAFLSCVSRTSFASVFTLAASILLIPDDANAQTQITSNQFNPAISLIIDGQYSNYSNLPIDYEIPGFLIDHESGPAPEGFTLDETELTASANIDDQFYGSVTIALHEEETGGTEVELEEAYFQTLALPKGLTVKGGKFFSSIGYHNIQHPHSWDFADAPLPYQAMLGTTYSDTGVQGRWLAPTDLFLEFGVEAFKGSSPPAADNGGDGQGTWTAFVKTGGDVGTSHSWKGGLSYLDYDVVNRNGGVEFPTLDFNGAGDVLIADFVWKWAENGNPKKRNFVVQAEYLMLDEDGNLNFFNGTANETGPYVLDQDGFYVQGVYQFMPQWRAGVRYDEVSASNTLPTLTIVTPLTQSGDPKRYTAMVDYAHSEFSRFRLQYVRDEATLQRDNQIILQFVMSIGAHGAHQF